ncbi:MAG: ACT domain-containing protein [Anaerolineaceae bacterium]
MAVYRSVRVHLPDRPGTLSAIAASLAAHGVDIVRLDVVSHEGRMVVDDLYLSADSQDSIGSAVGGFHSDVTVRTFEGPSGDPTLVLGGAVALVAGAASIQDAELAFVEGARVLLRGDVALLLEAQGDELRCTVPKNSGRTLEGETAAAAWWCLRHSSAVAIDLRPRPRRVAGQPEESWMSLSSCGDRMVIAVIRQMNIHFYAGELERLVAFAQATAAVLSLRADFPTHEDIVASPEGALPASAVILDAREPAPLA